MATIKSCSGFFCPNTTRPGVQLRYAHMPCPSPPKGTVLLLHGRTEFIEKYGETIADLNKRHFDVWTFDWRGQGLSTRMLANHQKGHIDTFETYLRDLSQVLSHLVKPRTSAPMLLMAHSMGGHLALRYLQGEPSRFDGAILCAPMIRILNNSILQHSLAAVCRLACQVGLSKTYLPMAHSHDSRDEDFASNRLTSDPAQFEQYIRHIRENPALAIGGPTCGWLGAAVASMAILETPEVLESIHTPTLLVSPQNDTVVSSRIHHVAAARMQNCELILLEGSKHEVLVESHSIRDAFWQAFDDFVLRF